MSKTLSIAATVPFIKHADDVEAYKMSFAALLDADETIESAAVAASGITVGSATVNASAFTVYDLDGETEIETVAIGDGIEFTCSAGTAGNDYEIKITATTSNGRTIARILVVRVRD